MLSTYSSFWRTNEREKKVFLFRIDQRSSARKNRDWIFRSVHAPLGFAAPRGVVPFASISRAGGEYANTTEIKETVAPSCLESRGLETHHEPTHNPPENVRCWYRVDRHFHLRSNSRLKYTIVLREYKKKNRYRIRLPFYHILFSNEYYKLIINGTSVNISRSKECQTGIQSHVKWSTQ